MWNNLSKGLLAAVVVAGALAAYLFLNQGALRQQADENEKKAQALEQQLAQAKSEVDKLAKEKEAELAKLKQAQNEMLQSLKKEVEAGEVMVNQLADRLSVKILDKILFASGEATISGKGQSVLKRVGKVLAQARDKDKIIRIEGHTDNVPIGAKIRTSSPPTGNSPPRAPLPSCVSWRSHPRFRRTRLKLRAWVNITPSPRTTPPKAASKTGASISFFIRACRSWRRNCQRRKNRRLLI